MIDWQPGDPPTDIGGKVLVWNGEPYTVWRCSWLNARSKTLVHGWRTDESEIRMITHWARITPPAGEKEETEYP